MATGVRHGVRITSYRGISINAEHWYAKAWRDDGRALEEHDAERRLSAADAADLNYKDECGGAGYRAGDTSKRFDTREAALAAGVRKVSELWNPDGPVEEGSPGCDNNPIIGRDNALGERDAQRQQQW